MEPICDPDLTKSGVLRFPPPVRIAVDLPAVPIIEHVQQRIELLLDIQAEA